MTFENIISSIILLIIPIYWLNLHFRTKSQFDRWAYKNEYIILKTRYIPFYLYGFLTGGGFHPANFLVTVKDKTGIPRKFSIAGGGIFWLSDAIKVKELR